MHVSLVLRFDLTALIYGGELKQYSTLDKEQHELSIIS